MKDILKLLLVGAVGLILTSTISFGQQRDVSSNKSVADSVARFIEQVREQNKLPKLSRIRDQHLQEDICSRAKKGDKSTGQSSGIGPPEKVGMLSVLWYSTLYPNQPVPELLDWVKGPRRQYEQPHRFAVAVCMSRAKDDSEQRYWVEIGTYMSWTKSLLNVPTWD